MSKFKNHFRYFDEISDIYSKTSTITYHVVSTACYAGDFHVQDRNCLAFSGFFNPHRNTESMLNTIQTNFVGTHKILTICVIA